jgi:hypothetical protein
MKISQAVGMGFLIMGAIGYLIKLSEWPICYYVAFVFPVFATTTPLACSAQL